MAEVATGFSILLFVILTTFPFQKTCAFSGFQDDSLAGIPVGRQEQIRLVFYMENRHKSRSAQYLSPSNI